MTGKNGGARPGAGRPKGSTTRPEIRDYFNEKDRRAGRHPEERAKTDSTILKFLGEQIFGKAPQPLTGEDGGPIQIKGVEITVRK